MFFGPFALLFTWIVGLLSVALLGGGVYVLWQWYIGALIGTTWLIAGLAMTAWTFVGRWIVLLFRRSGRDEPGDLPGASASRLERPDGTVLSVHSAGPADGPTLVLTHGAGANATSWYYLYRSLMDRFRLVSWDMPGLGSSSKAGGGDYSLERHAADLRAVVETAAQDRPVVLVGHSMGGMVTLTFCRLYPELVGHTVAGVVLVDSSHTNPARTTTASGVVSALQKPVLEPLLHITAWLAPIAWVMSFTSYMSGMSHLIGMILGFAGSETRGQLDRAALYNLLAWPGVQARETLAMFRYDATPTLAKLGIPMLCITGDLDRLIVPETSRWMADAAPNAEARTLASSGHMLVFEQHGELTETVAAFAARAIPMRTTPFAGAAAL